MDVFGGVIKLQDNVSGVLKQAAKSSGTFRSEVQKAKAELEKFDKQKLKEKEIRVKNSAAYKAIEGVKKKLEPVTSKVIELKAREERAVSSIKKVSSALSKVKENKVINFATKGAAAVTKAATTVAVAGTVAAVGAVAAAGTAATKQAIDFQAEMQNVATLLDGDVSGKVKSLGTEVKKISMDTGVSTSNLTSGLYEVVSAFGDTADSTKQLEVATKAAKAGNAVTADSVKMLSAVTKGYGDTSAAAVQKAADLAFQTVKLGQTSFPELAASMGAVVPLASTLKVSQEQLFGAMATLTGVTGSTSEVTTQLKATLQGFMSPSNEMSKALKKMGYSSGAAALESEGLGTILTKLKDSVKGDEVAFASMFSSVEAKNAVLALAGTQAENFATKTEAMNTASGAADEAFRRQTSSVKEMAARIKNSGSVILTSLGERALPVLEKGLSAVADYMPQFESAVTSAADAIGPVFEVAGGAVSQLWDNWQPRLSELAPLVSGTMSNVANGIQTALPVVSSIFEGIGGVASAVLPVISTIAQDMGGKVTRIFDIVGQHTGTMQSVFAAAGPAISSVLSTSWSVISPILDLAIEGFNLVASVVGWAFPYIESVITSVWSVVGPVVSAIGDGISAVAGAFKKAADTIGGSAKKASSSASTVNSAVSSQSQGKSSRVGANATGTSYWRGGYTTLAEHGPEIVDLPTGTKVYSKSNTENILNRNRSVNVNIENLTVREEADIDKVAEEIVKKLEEVDM